MLLNRSLKYSNTKEEKHNWKIKECIEAAGQRRRKMPRKGNRR